MVRDDFNGDGRSDILWRDDSGVVTDWLGTSNGGFVANWSNANVGVPLNWTIVGTGDFDGDTISDVLWRDDAGVVTDWLGDGSGGFASNWTNANFRVPLSWTVAGIGDFNGDGRSDILWRNTSGVITTWLGNQTGGFDSNWANPVPGVSSNWHVVGTGDFDGDHLTDILWQNDAGYMTQWFGTGMGSFDPTNDLKWMPASVVGIGDFNGDGRSDVVLLDRPGGGFYYAFPAQPDGSMNWYDLGVDAFSDTGRGWTIAQIGDFDGDHVDDILWRNSAGDVTDWLGVLGYFGDNSSNALHSLTTNWHVQPNSSGAGIWDY